MWTLWAKRFLEEQGYHLKRNIFYQDNESAIKLEKNGQTSSSGKTRHIHIRYFFTKDVVKRENIDISHCPTEEMIADFYTKPLQGKQFKKMRDILMGLAPMPTEERVGLCTETDRKESTVVHERMPKQKRPEHQDKNQVSKDVHTVRTYAEVVKCK